MLTKETKQTAERITQELAPLFATLYKLGDKLQKATTETRKAHDIATAWQYPTVRGYAEEAGEDWEEIKRTREQDAHKWHEILEIKYRTLSQAETLEKVARLNYRNYCEYIADTLAHLLHEGDTWATLYEKKGLESLTEWINNQTQDKSKKNYISIYRDGTGWEAFGSARFYCYLKINIWGVCCVRAESWGTYAETKKGDAREWKKPQAPQIYTLAQYLKIIRELKELENKAKATAREHHEKARKTGLIYFVGGLSDPHLETWGKNL